jgi:hypothetical protein
MSIRATVARRGATSATYPLPEPNGGFVILRLDGLVPGSALGGDALELFGENKSALQTMKFSPLTGIETEARKTIQQAQVTLAQLQNLGSEMGQFTIEADAARGRLGDAPSPAALKERILGLLKSIDLPDQELSKVAASDRKWGIADYVMGILIYAQYTQGGVEKYAEITPDRLEELLKKFDVLDDHEKSLIAE